MIYPKKNTPPLKQLNGQTGQEEMALSSGERIFSREATKKIVALSKSATDEQSLIKLGEFVYKEIKRQDQRGTQYKSE